MDLTRLVPEISSINPNFGTNQGPVLITNLSGKHFNYGAKVYLTRTGYPDIEAKSVIVDSQSKIQCELPVTGAEEGVWNVVVKNTDEKVGTSTNGFTITSSEPIVNTIKPTSGYNSGNIATTITGTNFLEGATVSLTRMGCATIVGTNVALTSATQITCEFLITGKPAGAWNVEVTNPGGQTEIKNNAFTILASPPTITRITPTFGYNTGNVAITISGTKFRTGATVKLTKGSITKEVSVLKITSNQITCTLPLSRIPTGRYSLSVKNSDGTSVKKVLSLIHI